MVKTHTTILSPVNIECMYREHRNILQRDWNLRKRCFEEYLAELVFCLLSSFFLSSSTSLPLTALNIKGSGAMATALRRGLGFFISSFEYCYFRYLSNHNNSHRRRNNKNNMPKGRPLALQTVELQVRMCCTGCERVVRNAILKLRGVDSIEVDLAREKVTVIGYVDPNKVLKAVRRSGKRAEFWPNPDRPLYFTSSNNYFKDLTNDYKESYNYWRHGYNVGERHGTLHETQRGDDKVSNMFNDDNVNACHVM